VLPTASAIVGIIIVRLACQMILARRGPLFGPLLQMQLTRPYPETWLFLRWSGWYGGEGRTGGLQRDAGPRRAPAPQEPHFRRAAAFGRDQGDPRSPDMLLCVIAIGNNRLQPLPIPRPEPDRNILAPSPSSAL
jgi:hypothetical protein